MKTVEEKLKAYNEIVRQTWPYGFKNWMNQLWQIFRKEGSFKDSCPLEAMTLLDPNAWIEYFMVGLSPRKAYLEDLKEVQ